MNDTRSCLLIATGEHQRVMDLIARDAIKDPGSCSVETVAAERFDDVPWHDRVCLISPNGVVALPVIGHWPLMGASGPEAVRALATIISTSPRDTNTHAFTWSSNRAFSDSCRRIAGDATRETSMRRMSDLDDAVDRDGLKGGDLVCEVGMSDEGDPIVRVDTPMEMTRLTITDDLRSRIVSEEPMFLMDNLALDVVAADLGPVDVAFHPILNDESGFVLTVPRLGPMDILRSLSGDQP
jgi:hypothetical protein